MESPRPHQAVGEEGRYTVKQSLVYTACLASVLPGALACGGRALNVGSETQSNPDSGREDGGETQSNPDSGREDSGSKAPPPRQPGTCSALTWGDSVNPASRDDCKTFFLGRWTLCDGGTPPQDPGFPYFLPQPDGIEFAQESGVMRFYVLVRDAAGALQRSQAPNKRGAATHPAADGSSCSFGMGPDSSPENQTSWTMQLYQNPDALLVGGYASYVPSP
jgi:hypothetical protein